MKLRIDRQADALYLSLREESLPMNLKECQPGLCWIITKKGKPLG